MRWWSRTLSGATVFSLVVLAGCSTPSAPSVGPPSPPSTAVPLADSPGPTVTPSSTSAAPSTSPTTSSRPSASRTSAGPSTTPSARKKANASDRPVIVIDPGHSGRSIRSRTVNGLLDFDYPNYPEMVEAFDISACVAQGLHADGYRVIMTKKRANDSISLTERARVADRARADLAISVHDDHNRGPSFQATYSQRGVEVNGRYPTMWRGTGSRRTVFDQPKIAKASERAARIIARERTRAQGRTVSVRQNSFTRRAPLEPGNLAMVQLLSHVPWVYNEMGARTDGSTTRRLSLAAETAYAKGLLDGVEAAVPISGRTSNTSAAKLKSCLRSRR